jgi:hypothetical protein
MPIVTAHTDIRRCLTARFTRTQTRKGCLASKVLLRSGVLRKRSLGPVNGGVRPLENRSLCVASKQRVARAEIQDSRLQCRCAGVVGPVETNLVTHALLGGCATWQLALTMYGRKHQMPNSPLQTDRYAQVAPSFEGALSLPVRCKRSPAAERER